MFTKKVITLSFLAAVFLAGAMQNCTNARLIKNSASSVTVSASPFGKLRPVLAVRNTGCIMCHARIDGDLITDLGAGSSFFMGSDKKTNHPNQPYYSWSASKHFLWRGADWSGSSITGNVYVPDQAIRDASVYDAYSSPIAGNPPLNRPLTVLDFVTGKYLDPFYKNQDGSPKSTSIISRTKSPDLNIPGLRGEFYSRKSIWIDSPDENEIRTLEQLPGAQQVFSSLGVVVYKASSSDTFLGLVAQQSSKTYKYYLTNSPILTCKGDIIIDGVLFLNNLTLDTDSLGCRLYVTGSVFIQGPIVYLNGGNSNLQISSSRAVIMGMRSLIPRFTQDLTAPAVSGIRQGFTDDLELAFNQKIFDDRDNIDDLTDDAGPFQKLLSPSNKVLATLDDFDNGIWNAAPGITSFPDPSTCCWSGSPSCINAAGIVSCARFWSESHNRKSINYSHLLLNAPKISSRYYGTFEGVIIGEDVLFAVDNFVFKSDPVMLQTPLLPLVKNRIFNISDN